MNIKFLSIIILILIITSCNNSMEVKNKPTTLTEMIGQMIMVGFRGMEVDSINQQFLNQIDSGFVGGIILFDYDIGSKSTNRNIKSPNQVKTLIENLKEKSKRPLLVAVDQEGGMVNRLKPKYGFPKVPSAKYLGEVNNLDTTRYYAGLNAKNMKELGFNLNFAPVVDIDINPKESPIGKYERSFSDNSEIVIKHASEWVKIHDSLGILSTLKHFPGHGSSDTDSHEGVTDITEYWKSEELIPFKKVSELDFSVGIMTAHVVNNNLDSIYPATLSKNIISKILRTDWGFNGLIFSDDLQMKAVNELYSFEEILMHSINAGVDVLVFGNNLEYDEKIPQKAVGVIRKLVKEGKIERERIEESYKRIIDSKNKIKK